MPVPINRDTQKENKKESLDTTSLHEKGKVGKSTNTIESFTFDNFGIQTVFKMKDNMLYCLGCHKWFERIKGHMKMSKKCQEKFDMSNYLKAIDEIKKDKKKLDNEG